MKSRKILEVKASATLAMLALALPAQEALAAESDAHAYVRGSILNTWSPTAVASQTEGKMDGHERARITIVGTSKYPSGALESDVPTGSGIDALEQARRLLLARPAASSEPAVVIGGRFSQ